MDHSPTLDDAALLPTACAVMVLPNTLLFPGQHLPLRIFEPRYRLMLQNALEDNRMFAIGTTRPDTDEEPVNFEPIGGLGLVRACVTQEDGTSQLILQGIARVRFTPPVELRPYRWCSINVITDLTQNPDDAARCQDHLRQRVRTLADLHPTYFQGLGETAQLDIPPAAFADLLAGLLPLATPFALRLLSEPIVEERLMTLSHFIDSILKSLESE